MRHICLQVFAILRPLALSRSASIAAARSIIMNLEIIDLSAFRFSLLPPLSFRPIALLTAVCTLFGQTFNMRFFVTAIE